MYLARKTYEPAGLYGLFCSGFDGVLLPRERASETVRTRGFVRFIHTVTVDKQRFR